MAVSATPNRDAVPDRALPQPPRWAMTCYRWLLRFAPARFRARHGDEMLMLFADRYRDASSRRGGLLYLWAGTLRDAVVSGLAERKFGDRFLRGGGNDARYAARALTARPATSALVIAVLALGLGASLAGWVLLRDVLLRPLPYPEAERLVAIWDTNPEMGLEHVGPTPANMLDWREQNRSFSGMAAWYANEPRTLRGAGDPVKVAVAEVTEDFFGLMSEPAVVGATFGAAEVLSDEPVVVLSHWLWVERFGGSEDIVGQTIELDGVNHRVTGVMSGSFAVPQRDIGVWVPWNFANGWPQLGYVPRDYRYLFVVARLADGVDLAAAQDHLDGIAAGLEEQYAENAGWRPLAVPLRDDIVGDLRPALVVLYGAVSLVLLIALTNAAHLVLGRELGRRAELGMRAALGASAYRLARQSAFEATFVTAIAALWAWALATVALRGVALVAPPTLPRLYEIGLDAAALGYLAVARARHRRPAHCRSRSRSPRNDHRHRATAR
ncbi:MAG: hypothetical protein GKS06_00275 [Acidobacteria bacterium]|nr:hypothetical protein [Acidobacteriota bacterium]